MMTAESSESTSAIASQPTKNRWIAVLFGLFYGGVGILYCGQMKLAIVVATANLLIGASLLWALLYGPNWAVSLPLLITIAAIMYAGNIVITWRVASGHAIEHVATGVRRFLLFAVWQLAVLGCGYGIMWCYGKPHSYWVPSAAMENTLLPGERFVASMNAYKVESPKRGDIVVFLWPGDGVTQYIKRCVALPGDTVAIRDTILYVNGVTQTNPSTVKFIDPAGHIRRNASTPTITGQNQRDYFGPYVVPDDCYFMLGDNRDNSSDSRVWGPVSRTLLLGRAIRITWSSDPDRVGKYLSN